MNRLNPWILLITGLSFLATDARGADEASFWADGSDKDNWYVTMGYHRTDRLDFTWRREFTDGQGNIEYDLALINRPTKWLETRSRRSYKEQAGIDLDETDLLATLKGLGLGFSVARQNSGPWKLLAKARYSADKACRFGTLSLTAEAADNFKDAQQFMVRPRFKVALGTTLGAAVGYQWQSVGGRDFQRVQAEMTFFLGD